MEWKEFPNRFQEIYFEIPKDNPYATMLVGGYQGKLNENGHRYWVYYPEGMEYSCRHLVLLIPNSLSIDEFLEQTGWKKIADQEHLLLLMAGSLEDPFLDWEEAAGRLYDLDKIRNDRTFMDTQRAFSYFAGYGEGAVYGHRFVVERPSTYASAAFFGKAEIEKEILASLGSQGSAAPDIKKREVPCPVCFVGNPSWYSGHILEYWQAANQTEKEPYQQKQKTIWLPDAAQLESTVEHQPVARVELLDTNDPMAKGLAEEVWATFLSRTVRATGILNGDLHPYRTAEQWGCRRKEIQVDGWTRHWYEYVPKRLSILADKKIPVVVFFHGGSASALSGLYSHEWVQVAKERGFLLLMPTGTMRKMDQMMPHPAWNAARVEDHMDDEKFIRSMLEDVKARFAVDSGRIYVCGHSMGSAMTQRAALAMPDIFTAAASNSGVVTGGFMGDFDTPGVREDLPIPIWIQMGENDVGGGTLENNPKAARTIRYWVSRYGLPDAESPFHWRSGRYLNQEWRTEKGVPMVRYTTTLEKPHAITPQDPWLYYDEFFSRFFKGEDGSLYFQGKKVK